MLKLVLPRFVLGNRGDIASRWGVINALHHIGMKEVTIFCDSKENVPPVPFPTYQYGKLRNLLLPRAGLKALMNSDIVLWTGGLDFQDDSSLLKLIYLWINFHIYRFFGLRIWCFLQGAGPLNTSIGRWIAQKVLNVVDVIVARDSASAELLEEINSKVKTLRGHDGIFLPGFESALITSNTQNPNNISALFAEPEALVIGFNIRLWFHLRNTILPYQFSQRQFQQRAKASMELLIETSRKLIAQLRSIYHARVILLSGYQPGIVPWEDDLPWLEKIKEHFQEDPQVVLADFSMTMPEYFGLLSSLDCMIAMRLHSTLLAMRFGVPGINLNYTLKGRAILADMGLQDYIVELDDYLRSPEIVLQKVEEIVKHRDDTRFKVKTAVDEAIRENLKILQALFSGSKQDLL